MVNAVDSEKKGLPTYIKVIIGMVVLTMLCTIALGVIGINYIGKSFTPQNAARVANEMVDLPDPLPSGWHYGAGIDVGPSKVANVQYRRGRTRPLVQFTKMGNRLPAKVIAANLKMPSTSGMTFEFESRGEEIIGGKTAYY